MKTEKVYSPIHDKNIQSHIKTSEVWTKCEHSQAISKIDTTGWYEYTIKFEGLEPIQCTKIKKI